VAEIGKNAISEIKILHALTSNELLVKRIERSNIYCDDFIKNMGILCTGQNSNPNLPSKFKQVVLLFQGDYPLFLQSLENKLCNDGDPSIELEYYNKIVNILEELTKILREISIIFNTQLEKVSGRQRSKSTNVRALNNVVDGLINNLAKLNTVVDEQEQKKLSQGLQDETKNLIQSLNQFNVGKDDKVELVQAIRSGIISNEPNEFFKVRDSISEIMDSISEQVDDTEEVEKKDLIEATKEMCENFKNITTILNE